jgi:cytochrome c
MAYLTITDMFSLSPEVIIMIKYALLLTLASSPALALDGKALYNSKLCMTCHGAEGKAPTAPIYPSLAGKDEKCMNEQFDLIKTGKRGGMAVAMKAMIANVSDEERDAIAKYLAGLPAATGVTEPATTVCKAP